MQSPKYQVGDKVKFHTDHDGMAGEVLSIGYTTEGGYIYKISSRSYDSQLNDMVEGYKICREKEIVAVKTK